ncbi:MAG: Ig-like domain-containing protein, partial [Treponema sp.]|nr:Ig-like domain-containing protein [Treponema sp.]
MKRLGIMAAVVIASSALFFGCDNGNGDDGDTTVKVTGVTITGTGVANGAASVAVDATLTLIATVEPANATNKTVTWKSSDTTKATVSETGVVTGVAAGEATITATAGGGGSTATVTITVTEPAKVESVTIKQNGIEVTEPIALPANDTVTLTAEVSPSNTNDADKAITWSTSDSAVATVTDGVVTW